MDREDAAKLLQKNGYTVDNSGSVMMVLVGEDKRKKISDESNVVGKVLRGAGYYSSFGVKVGEKGSA